MNGRRKGFDALGPVLRELRIERGLTQAELAERAGSSKSMLSLYERGKQHPQLETLEKLLDALEVRLGELVTRLESWPAVGEAASARRGPRRSAPLVQRPEDPYEEAVSAATEVLQGIAALLEHAIRGEPGEAGPRGKDEADSGSGEG